MKELKLAKLLNVQGSEKKSFKIGNLLLSSLIFFLGHVFALMISENGQIIKHHSKIPAKRYIHNKTRSIVKISQTTTIEC